MGRSCRRERVDGRRKGAGRHLLVVGAVARRPRSDGVSGSDTFIMYIVNNVVL